MDDLSNNLKNSPYIRHFSLVRQFKYIYSKVNLSCFRIFINCDCAINCKEEELGNFSDTPFKVFAIPHLWPKCSRS